MFLAVHLELNQYFIGVAHVNNVTFQFFTRGNFFFLISRSLTSFFSDIKKMKRIFYEDFAIVCPMFLQGNVNRDPRARCLMKYSQDDESKHSRFIKIFDLHSSTHHPSLKTPFGFD